jgi:Tfp pilus assembly protein PilF
MLGLSLLELPEPPSSAVVRPDRGSYLARTRVLLINGPGVGPDSVSARIYQNFQLRDFPDLCPVDAQVTGAAPVVDSTGRFLGVACDLSSGPDQFGYIVPAVSVGVLAQIRLERPVALSDLTRSPAPGFETDSTAGGLLFRGAALIQIGRFEAAEHYLRRAEKQDGSMLEIYQWLGRALFGREQYRPAVEEFLYVAERDTANHWAWHMAGAASHQAKDYAAAETLYKRALRVNPKAADTYCNLGGTYSVLGRRAEAEAALRTSIQIDPRSREGLAHFNLASVLHHAGREAGVDSIYRALLELDPAWAERMRKSMEGSKH